MQTETKLAVTVERGFPAGEWRVSAMHGGRLVQRRYFGYAKREAVTSFRREVVEGARKYA